MLPSLVLQPLCTPCGWPFYPLVRIDCDLKIRALNGQVTIVRGDLQNPYNVGIPGVGSFRPYSMSSLVLGL